MSDENKPDQLFRERTDPKPIAQTNPDAVVIVFEDENSMRTALCEGINDTPGLMALPIEPNADRLLGLKSNAELYNLRTIEGRDVIGLCDVSVPRPYGTDTFPNGFAAAAYLERMNVPVVYSTSLARAIEEHEGASNVTIRPGAHLVQKTGNLMNTVGNAINAVQEELASYRAAKANTE